MSLLLPLITTTEGRQCLLKSWRILCSRGGEISNNAATDRITSIEFSFIKTIGNQYKIKSVLGRGWQDEKTLLNISIKILVHSRNTFKNTPFFLNHFILFGVFSRQSRFFLISHLLSSLVVRFAGVIPILNDYNSHQLSIHNSMNELRVTYSFISLLLMINRIHLQRRIHREKVSKRERLKQIPFEL